VTAIGGYRPLEHHKPAAHPSNAAHLNSIFLGLAGEKVHGQRLFGSRRGARISGSAASLRRPSAGSFGKLSPRSTCDVSSAASRLVVRFFDVRRSSPAHLIDATAPHRQENTRRHPSDKRESTPPSGSTLLHVQRCTASRRPRRPPADHSLSRRAERRRLSSGHKCSASSGGGLLRLRAASRDRGTRSSQARIEPSRRSSSDSRTRGARRS
jgi:hypothetical protein